MIDILNNIEKNILPTLLKNNEAWNGVDVKITQPRSYYLWSKIDEYYLTFSKKFYCSITDLNFIINDSDTIIHFLDGFWELNNCGVITQEHDNNSTIVNKEEDTLKNIFIIKEQTPFTYRSFKQKDWIYSLMLSKTKPNFIGNVLKKENIDSLLQSAKILIY